jgi:ubiquinone/menaquinone biosynthesis C-methylase UbiE
MNLPPELLQLQQSQTPSEIALPSFSMAGKRVLDVGCATGKDLLHPIYASAAERCGIDPDEQAIRYGRSRYPTLQLRIGAAELLPYPDRYFDFVVSRVTIPLTDVPGALREMARVMKPGASLLLTLHDYRYQLGRWRRALRCREWKTVLLDPPYVLAASALCCLGLSVPTRPNGSRATFMSMACARRLIARAGFVDVRCEKDRQYFIARAMRA